MASKLISDVFTTTGTSAVQELPGDYNFEIFAANTTITTGEWSLQLQIETVDVAGAVTFVDEGSAVVIDDNDALTSSVVEVLASARSYTRFRVKATETTDEGGVTLAVGMNFHKVNTIASL